LGAWREIVHEIKNTDDVGFFVCSILYYLILHDGISNKHYRDFKSAVARLSVRSSVKHRRVRHLVKGINIFFDFFFFNLAIDFLTFNFAKTHKTSKGLLYPK
jgi:hypothetical protein